MSLSEEVEKYTELTGRDGLHTPIGLISSFFEGYEKGKTESQQWIPVTERLPEEERKNYWICTDTGYQCECRWTNNCFGIGESDEWGWSIFDIPRFSHVVAWRELPEPYRGGEEECH